MFWLLEQGIFGTDLHPLHDASAKAGHEVVVWQDDCWAEPAGMPAAADEALVFHGSHGNANRIAEFGRWKPSAYCNAAGLACSGWYSDCAQWLANPRHRFTTVRDLTQDPAVIAGELASADGACSCGRTAR